MVWIFKKLNELLFSKEEKIPEIDREELLNIQERIEEDKKLVEEDKIYVLCEFCSGPIVDKQKKFCNKVFHKRCFKAMNKMAKKELWG